MTRGRARRPHGMWEALYRRTIWVLPRDFRAGFGQDIIESFRDLSRAARLRGGPRAAAAVWLRATIHLLLCGARERLAVFRKRFAPPDRGPGRRGPLELRGAATRVSQDIRFSVRSYLRSPGFALTAVVIIALGVGATTTIFSVVDTVVLRRLPYPAPGQLVFFDNPSHSAPLYRDWRDRTDAFATMAAAWDRDIDITQHGAPERLDGALVTRDFLDLFGAEPFLGRLFTNDDFTGEAQVAVLSHGLWQRRFGADESVLGRTITVGGRPLVVVGVLDPNFAIPQGVVRPHTDMWLPLDIMLPVLQHRGLFVLQVVARLRPTVSLEAAQVQVDGVARALASEIPDRYQRSDGTPVPMEIVPLHDAMVGDLRGTLYMFLGAVGLMLVIACANVANLFLARGTAREREMALRAALGAGRRRLMTQLLTESVVLALVGGVLGVVISYVGVRGFVLLNPGNIPRVDQVAVDLRVLAFALAVSAATGMLFGLLPAMQASRTDVNDALKDSSATTAGMRRRTGIRNTLVVAEIALALVLLVGAGLLFNSFLHRIRVDPGFAPDRLITVPLVLSPDSYDEATRLQFARRVMERLETIPGVREVAMGVTVPLMYYGSRRCCWRSSGFHTDLGEERPDVHILMHPVSTGYFSVLEADVRGREFQPVDANTTSPAPAVVSDEVAQQFFPGIDPVGHTLRSDDLEFMVVGVVSRLHQWGLDEAVELEMFVPYETFGAGFRRLNFLVRTDADPSVIAGAVREAIWTVDPNLPVDEVITMRQRIATSLVEPRFYSVLLLVFAGIAILLAAGGIYGSMLYTVGQRQRELGIRIALGARGSELVRMVVGHGLMLALIGIGLGTAGALGLARTLQALVFGITITDGPTFVTMAVLLGLVVVTASYVPARRAARTDPIGALRSE